jgi:arsenate reductase-like glutaredoxin family protein
MYEIYTNEMCSKCDEVKAFFAEKRAYYREYIIGKDITLEKLKELFPRAKVLPIIMKNGLRITSLEELRDTFEPENIIRFDSKL